MKNPIIQSEKDLKHLVIRCAFLTGLILVADQITKIVVENRITSSITVIPGLFNLVFVKNSGAAWGILAGKGWLLLLISVIVFVLIVVFIRRIAEGWPERYYSMALVAGGIVGNSVDRIWRGSVVDFLDFHYGSHHWPAFNVADSAICVGVFIFIISSWFRPQTGDGKSKPQNPSPRQ
ncbi:MAG: signal peptidase II [Victivallales bacterium]